jgi:NAD+ kinase
MKNIGVIVNRDKDIDLKYTKLLIDNLKCKDCNVLLGNKLKEDLNLKNSSYYGNDVINESDIIISLGGDGTFLKTARDTYGKNIPILGVNLGTLGFLTEVEKNKIDFATEKIINDNYLIEERMMLKVKCTRDNKILFEDFALNDIVISRSSISRIIQLKTYIDDNFIDSFPGDGIIISTPTGSTAYSLSAGGPIVEPTSDMFIITPVCPHILTSRSYISEGNKKIKTIVDRGYNTEAVATVDGQIVYNIRKMDKIEIEKADYKVKFIKINNRNFYGILRSKLYEREVNLIKDEV